MSRKAHEYVDECAYWAHELAQSESRGPGDYANAMERIERKCSVAKGTLWKLRYRRPKTIGVEVYNAIQGAYLENREKYEAERADFEPRTKIGALLLGAVDGLHRAADAVAPQEDGAVTWDGGGVWWSGTKRPSIASRNLSATTVFRHGR